MAPVTAAGAIRAAARLIKVAADRRYYWSAVKGATRRQSSAPALARPFRNIAVIRLDGLGDAILTTPMLRELKRNFPEATVTGILEGPGAKVLELCPYLDKVFSPTFWPPRKEPFPVRMIGALRELFLRELQRETFDLVLCPRFGLDRHGAYYLGALLGPEKVVAYGLDPIAKKTFQLLVPVNDAVKHEVERNLDCLRFLELEVRDNSLALRPTASDTSYAADATSGVEGNSKLVLVGIGATSRHKQWSVERYAAVIQQVSASVSLTVGIVSGPGEELAAEQLAKLIRSPRIELRGASLGRLLAVMERASAYVGNDSGPAHLAAAANCPTVVISPHWVGAPDQSEYSPARFAPFSKSAKVIRPLSYKGACGEGCVAPIAHCIEAITVQMVSGQLLTMLGGPETVGD